MEKKTRFTLDQSIGALLHRTTLAIKSSLKLEFETLGYDISSAQWAVLLMLHERDGRLQSELAKQGQRDKPAVTRIIDALEKKQLVIRKSVKGDRRSWSVCLTDQGRLIIENLLPVFRWRIRKLVDGFSDFEIATLRSMIDRINANVREMDAMSMQSLKQQQGKAI